MEQILVYKASAGSGKTFRLALEYLKLLLSKPLAHRHILAVSFTNKATGEMKQRILGELYGMAHNCEKSDVYLQILASEMQLSEEEIREKSKLALNVILHDYGFFQVETIDSFYQRVLRNMAKELGLGAYFNIELDNKKALNEAVHSLINSLSADTESLQWICEIIADDAENEKYSKSIEKDLVKTGAQIFEEIFRRHQTEIEAFFQSKKHADEYIKTLYARRKQALQKLEKTENENEQNQLETEINSCNLILKHLRNMGLLSDISRHLAMLNQEQNRFLLADTSALLYQMIGENDTSFLYEKIGANLHHILIDEFQDTSDMQWRNFKLLFLENLSKNHSNLIVGDVKQAIYRWRNSNWETLNAIEKEFYEGAVDVKTLNTNYRTDATVVNFNNTVFKKAIDCLKLRFDAEIGDSSSDLMAVLRKAYQDVAQTPNRPETKGFVEVQFVKKDRQKSQQAQTLIDTMLRLQEAKIKPEDIMILVRNSSHIHKISDAFEVCLSTHPDLNEETKNYFKLVSDEAFRLSSSSAIGLIIDAFRALSKQHTTLHFAQLAYDFQEQNHSTSEKTKLFTVFQNDLNTAKNLPFREFLPQDFCENYSCLQKLPLYELSEKIIRIFNLFEQKNQHAFLYDFLDKMNVYIAQNSSNIDDFLEYWEDELQNKTIALNAHVPGIRILTIHKSKGLEFHTVVVPISDRWYVDHDPFHDQLIWHENARKDQWFEQVPLVPLNYGDSLKNSFFTDDFQKETLKLWVDNLNLLYVAFTRPKHNLLVVADALPKAKKENSSDAKKKLETLKIAHLLHQSLPQLNDDIFQAGQLVSSGVNQEETWDENVFKVPMNNVEIPFSVATQQPQFYLSDETRKWYKNIKIGDHKPSIDKDSQQSLTKGLLYHRILAEIRTVQQVGSTLERWVFDGLISADEKTMMTAHLHELFKNPSAQDWFSEKYRVFKECKIVKPADNGRFEHRRPDRVMQDENGNLILIDFKTGQKYPQHREQIAEYANLLQALFSDRENLEITGYLWYLDTNEIESAGTFL